MVQQFQLASEKNSFAFSKIVFSAFVNEFLFSSSLNCMALTIALPE